MADFEDHFSKLAREYARFRPVYPAELFATLAAISPGRGLAWDAGTGNGQAARALAEHFERVVATDASADQIAQAPPHERISYRVEPAEGASIEAGSVDLVTAAAAVHWFDLDRFYSAVRRAAVPGGILAVWGYHFPVINPAVDGALDDYYHKVLAGYWPAQLKYLEDHYQTLPFPFEEVAIPDFEMRATWDLEHLAGFMGSWTASRRYLEDRGVHPVSVIWGELGDAWGEADHKREIRWPLYMRVGHVG